MEFSHEQLKAIDYCTDTKRRIVAISGQAGTGKTTIIRKAHEALMRAGRLVALAAPTGRAARRIYEATGIHAVTVHKLLAYGKPIINENTGEPIEEVGPGYTREQPLPYSDIIVDEFMMVNEELYRDLIDALRPGARLLAFGDVSQLPPIEKYEIKTVEGAPFERLLKLPSSVILETVYRQGEGSGLLENARRIRNGIPPVKKSDFSIKISEVPIKDLRDFVLQANADGMDFSKLDNQIISPARKGKLGTHSLNSILQSLFFGRSSGGISLPREKWQEIYPISINVGEKVICQENTYDLRDFFERFERWDGDIPIWSSFIPVPESFMMLNGEIGVVTDILPDGSLDIDFGDRVVHVPSSIRDYIARFNRVYQRDPRKKLDLAYAITTHKMQGSECDNVCLLLHQTISPNINRNNVYTAVTRAKKSVHLITDTKMLFNGMKLTAAQQRKNRAQSQQLKGFSIGDI